MLAHIFYDRAYANLKAHLCIARRRELSLGILSVLGNVASGLRLACEKIVGDSWVTKKRL